jgi:hypothetical protein
MASIVYHETKHTYTCGQQKLKGLTTFLRRELWLEDDYQQILDRARQQQRQERHRGQQVLTVASCGPSRRRKWKQRKTQARWWRRPDGSRYQLAGSVNCDFGTWVDRQMSLTVNRYQPWPPPPRWIQALHPTTQVILAKAATLGTPRQAQVVVGSRHLGVATRIDLVVVDAHNKHWLIELKTFCAFTYHKAVHPLFGGKRTPARKHQVQAIMTEWLFRETPAPTPRPTAEAVLLLVNSRTGQPRLVRTDRQLRQRVYHWANQLRQRNISRSPIL